MDYQYYNTQDFIEDRSFVKWVIDPDEACSKYWEKFVKDHPEKRTQVHQAKNLILKFNISVDERALHEEIGRIWTNLEVHIDNNKSIVRQSAKKGRLWSVSWLHVAAAVCFILGLSYLAYSNLDIVKDSETISEVKLIEKSNPKGRKSTITLSDRSRVELNAESSIQYLDHFSTNKREVSLVGEAFFNVERDELRPFIITVNGIKVKVLGTSFNIRAYPDEQEVHVSVLSGTVLVSDNLENNSVTITKNEMVDYHNILGGFTKKVIDDGDLIFGWKDQKLVFQNTDLNTLTMKLSRWYGVDFSIKGIDNKSKRITGSYANATLKEVMESLSHNYQFDYIINEKSVTITHKQ